MADRFPSIEDLDDDMPTSSGGHGNFLERERAALGEDAEAFAQTDPRAVTMEDGDDNLLGDDDYSAPTGGQGQEDLDFERSFPMIDGRNEAVGPGGSVTNTAGGGYTNYQPPQAEQDSEAIQQWREKRDTDIQRRDEESQRKKAESVETARKDIDSFYENYNRKLDKQKTQVAKESEEFMGKREDTTAGGTSWERIAKLVDLSGKGQAGGGSGSTKQKMREMLMSLKSDKDAPGAGGV